MMDEKKVLARVASRMGYSELRPKQEEVIRHFIRGRDVFVSLPTGSGKSLCYCLLPGVFDEKRHLPDQSIVIVVSPLVALMKDQVRAMTARNVRAVYVGDADDEDEDDASVDEICEGNYRLVFMSPESLLTDMRWRDMLQSPIYQENLVALVVDEAHCVKKWGEDFRKEFSNIGEARSLVPETVHLMALTATATKQSRRDICRTLGMINPIVVTASPNKPNIKYILKSKPGTLEETFAPLVEEVRRLRLNMERVIIFCRTYDSCGMIYLFMKDRLEEKFTDPIGAPDRARYRIIDMFTACTHPDVKKQILKEFCDTQSRLRVVVATIAFGMGLDCPNVRRVVHWGPSADIELYLQETGRAGRDGKQATAILYNTSNIQHVEESMKAYTSNKEDCRRKLLLKDFDGIDECSATSESMTLCSCCDVCESKCKCAMCCHSD